ncbi:unnamed protein product [Malus baccata var. baccata]
MKVFGAKELRPQRSAVLTERELLYTPNIIDPHGWRKEGFLADEDIARGSKDARNLFNSYTAIWTITNKISSVLPNFKFSVSYIRSRQRVNIGNNPT